MNESTAAESTNVVAEQPKGTPTDEAWQDEQARRLITEALFEIHDECPNARMILPVTYRDARGEPAVQVLTCTVAGGTRRHAVVWRRRDGNWSAAPPARQLPLYPPDGVPEEGAVWLVQEEGTADALNKIGLPGVCFAAGCAAKTDFAPLAGRVVFLLGQPDDEPAQWAKAAGDALMRLNPPPRARVVEPPKLPDGYTLVSYLDTFATDEGGRRKAGEMLAKQAGRATPIARPRTPVLVPMADLPDRAVGWLWPGRVPLGKLTLLCGDPGVGKSMLALDFAARVTTASPWPDGAPCPGGSVLLLCGEDDLADGVRPRLLAAGADLKKVTALHAVKRDDAAGGGDDAAGFTLHDADLLRRAMAALPDCRLVVIDPLGAFVNEASACSGAHARAVLAPIAALAAKRGAAVMLVTHLRKTTGTDRLLYRATGPLALVAACRASWLAARDPHDPTRRLLLPLKNNLAAEPKGIAYAIAEGRVRWLEGEVDLTPDQARKVAASDGGDDSAAAVTAATDWLRDLLAAGPVPSTDLHHHARQAGFGIRTVRRAKLALHIKPTRDGFGGQWMWRLPTETPAEVEVAAR